MPQPKKALTIAQSYYARKDIQQAIYDFCKNRETIANFNNEFFAKRPDALDYPADIFNSAKSGATSFHCSEELWQNPLEINTDMTPEQLNEIKIGWDFLIDIDSPFLDYGKIAARIIIQFLEHHNVNNIGVKFSGGKGFHILIPFKAFPKIIGEEETKNHFPDWARLIASYIHENTKTQINDEIFQLTSKEELEKKGELISEHLCPKCGNPSVRKKIKKFICLNCKTEMLSMTGTTKKSLQCPSCKHDMQKTSEQEINFCNSCNINTAQLKASGSHYGGKEVNIQEDFKKEETTKSQKDAVDIVLVSPRHLFRAPYSLHEKTSLASIVINKDEIDSFQPRDADPLKVKIKNFSPDCKEGEARELLIQAIDHAEKTQDKIPKKEFKGKSIDVKNLTITEDMYPGVIKNIMKGIKQDGRKRALSILLSFFSSLELPQDYIETAAEKWNKKNYKPLKTGYIKAQIAWYMKNPRLPPNYDKPIYRELALLTPGEGSSTKNPLNSTIKQAMKSKGKSGKRKNK
tara:strand:- start:5585 stop:7138 length:1554 start_codon:yes stop_codon:yes gene_type:complete